MIRLIATDLDGTVARSDATLSDRTRAAFAAAVDAGIAVTAVSGRQVCSIAAVVAGSALIGPAIGSNGAVAMNAATGETYFEELLAVDAQTALAHAMAERFPGLAAVSVRDGGNLYVTQWGFSGPHAPGTAQVAWPVVHRRASLAEVLAEPSVKLVLRHPDHSPDELYAAAVDLAVPGCHPTLSGADFLEVAREGVTKASALARVCAGLGIAAHEVLAFGDNVNDVEMLAWAGHGVATRNAQPEALAAADEVTASNDEDGVALVVERLLGRR